MVSKNTLVVFGKLAGISSEKDKVKHYLRSYRYPDRYFDRLTPRWERKLQLRLSELLQRQTGKPDYKSSVVDRAGSTRKSTYTQRWNRQYPDKQSLPDVDSVTGIPEDILQKVYEKGLAAWRGGHHRPGASQHAWAMARVYSFALKGKTYRFPDHRLVEEAKKRSPKAREFWKQR